MNIDLIITLFAGIVAVIGLYLVLKTNKRHHV